MNATAKRRVAALEQRQSDDNRPPYFVVDSPEQITDEMRAARVKIYVGISPDSWDEDESTNEN